MFFKLKADVFIVEGKAKSAIYDFNNKKLYQIDKKMLNFIRNLFVGKVPDKEYVDLLIENEIIEKSNVLYKEVSILSKKRDKAEFRLD